MRPTLAPKVAEYKLDSVELATLLRAAIDAGYSASFNAPGNSMLPFIHSGDKIFVAPLGKSSIRLGDVLVFIQPDSGHVLAHRVVKLKADRILCKGDNVANLFDGWVFFEDVLGRVVKVQREGKPIQFGLGFEKQFIASLSRKQLLAPLLNFLRKVKIGVVRSK
ncbi:MAG: S26 family signal peptidase [Anaerolineaceae bacterium]|jgi:phage repressor protein C with HTH and peptisase S24 domain|nr:S26 family signal peptidase [Anaerolineaceae bacterium]MDD4042254.1 S26 family signal peptidase [Anaerolineaceae bacterium]MDD4578069.1 S26 family signal peptidase [Anaerolineaceae bacterium]